MRALRITLLTIFGILTVSVTAAAIFVATFDANRYKPEIEQLVFKQTGRTLQIEGNIGLTLFPNIGAELGRTTLSDKDPKKAFVTLDATRVSVALLPLLSSKVLVDGVTIEGLSANITRDKGGAFNFADLMGSTEPKPTDAQAVTTASGTTAKPLAAATSPQTISFQFNVRSIGLTNASLTYTDQQSGMDWQVSNLNVKTGQIAPQSSGAIELSGTAQSQSMALNTKFNVTSDYKLDLTEQALDLTKLTTRLSGDWQDIKDIDTTLNLNLSADLGASSYTLTGIDGKLKANLPDQAADVILKTNEIKIAEPNITVAPSELAATLKAATRTINSELKLPAFAFANDELSLKALAVNISVTDPALGKQPLKLAANGDLSINTNAEKLSTQLAGQFDGSPFKATVGVAGFTNPAVTFDVVLDQLTLDRFAAAQANANTNASAGPLTNGQAGSVTASSHARAIDLSGLKGHNVKGKLRVGKVHSKGLTIDQVQADVALHQGRLAVAPHSAQLFGGNLTGSLAIDATTNQFTLQENITGIKLDSLLTALGQDPKLTGQGTLALDLVTAGTTVKALEQNLSGHARVNLKDGTVKGIDIGAIINNVRAMLGKAPTQQGTGTGETAFTELTASATLQKGIATNRDLNVKAPLFRLEGAGTVDIPNSTLDYLTKVAVVETSSGQGGKDLAALRGVTIPIKISGKFDSPQYSVDVASLAAELAKSQLGDKAQDEINKVIPGLGDALKGLFGR